MWRREQDTSTLQLSGDQQANLIHAMSAYLRKANNIELVRFFFKQDVKVQQKTLQFAAERVGVQTAIASKWFLRVYSQCAFNPLEPLKIPLLKLIIDVIPGYVGLGSLTTFVRDSLLDYQEQNNLHPGKFYDYVYMMCGKFCKAKNQLVRLQMELELMHQQERRNKLIQQQRKQLASQVKYGQMQIAMSFEPSESRASIVCESPRQTVDYTIPNYDSTEADFQRQLASKSDESSVDGFVQLGFDNTGLDDWAQDPTAYVFDDML